MNAWYETQVLTIPFLVIFSGFAAFMPTFQVDKFITSYIGIVVYVFNFAWWKLVKKTRRVRSKEADLVTGRVES